MAFAGGIWALQMTEAEGKGLTVEQWHAAVELGLLPTARPMVTFLMLGLGFSVGELEKLLDRREELLSIRVERARSRAAFLLDIGLSQEDVRKVRTPRLIGPPPVTAPILQRLRMRLGACAVRVGDSYGPRAAMIVSACLHH